MLKMAIWMHVDDDPIQLPLSRFLKWGLVFLRVWFLHVEQHYYISMDCGSVQMLI